MMNVLGLSLVLTSLAAAGVFSPTPTPTPAADTQQQPPAAGLGMANTIVKEGHRVVVVEYDQDGHHNTKISISPPEPEHEQSLLSNAKDKIKEAASLLPNVGQGISPHSHDPHSTADAAFLHASRDLICDAYGSCKHKIASAMGKAKDKAHDVLDTEIAVKREAAREVGDTVSDAAGKAKEAVYDKAQDVKDYARESVEKAKDTGQTVKSHMVRNASDARDRLRGVKGALERAASAGYAGAVTQLGPVADLMGFATAYGMCVWVTFISSYVLSRAMPRQQFAVVQSKIYPVYFRAMSYSVGMALLGHLLSHGHRLFSPNAQMFQACNLVASLLSLLLNSLYLEPRATKLMFERMKMEKEEGRGRDDLAAPEQRSSRTITEEEEHHIPDPSAGINTLTREDAVRSKIIKLNLKLKKLNSYSSILNILNLMSLTWHLVYLAQSAHHIC